MSTEKHGPSTAGDDTTETARMVREIEKTRADMSGTIAALESRLRPSEIRGTVDTEIHHVEEKVREVVREHLAEAKSLVKEELAEAKDLLRAEMTEAETKLRRGLSDLRDTVKKDLSEELDTVEAKVRKGVSDAKETAKSEIKEALTGAKKSARAATLGRVETLATTIGDTMNDTRETLVDTIRNNPIPAAIAGIGLAWLFMNRSSAAKQSRNASSGSAPSSSPNGIKVAFRNVEQTAGHMVESVGHALHGATDAAGNVLHGATDAAGNAFHGATDAAGAAVQGVSDAAMSALHSASDAAGSAAQGASNLAGRVATQASSAATSLVHGARDASSSLAHNASDAASYLATGAQSQARRVEQGFTSALHDNPLAVGAAVVAIGAVIGYSLPRTNVEDSLMGDARDEMFRRAEEATGNVGGVVGQLAEKASGTVKELLSTDAT